MPTKAPRSTPTDNSAMKQVVILGRPNVGKSTLFNRLAGRRLAIVHDQPGVTRDRRIAVCDLGRWQCEIVDTPGLEKAMEGSIANAMTAQSLIALKSAAVVLFVIDARTGLTSEDQHFAQLARKTGLPVVLVANKAEARIADAGVADAYRLGFGEPLPVSAEHGLGIADLWETLMPHLREDSPPEDEEGLEEEEEVTGNVQIAIVGRPNAGKSTLMNALLGEDRVLASPEAGTTRDAIMVETELYGRTIKLVDTAGMRRKAKVQESLERMSVGDTLHSIQYAHVVIVLLDATQPLEKQDNIITNLIEREGRACVLAVNKWDKITEKPELLLEDIRLRLDDVAPKMKGIPVIPISAAEGKGLDKLMKACYKMYDLWNTRIPTSEVNRWLEEATSRHMPPLVGGRRIKLRYATQAKTRPPTFFFFVNRTGLPDSYMQYLRSSLRDTFKLPGIPLRLSLRTGKNPYADST